MQHPLYNYKKIIHSCRPWNITPRDFLQIPNRHYSHLGEGGTEVLGQYRQRDMIENEYAILKCDLDIMPLRVHKTETLKGLLFIFYVSLVIRTHLLNRGRESGLLGKQSVEDILLELGKLRADHIGGTWRLAEVSKKQRTILEKMGISIPVELKK